MTPAARTNVFVAPNGTDADGIKMNRETTNDDRRANVLIVSKERRVVLIVCCGGMINYIYDVVIISQIILYQCLHYAFVHTIS